MTNPEGRVFVSYRRKRLSEIERLVRAIRERGVPTWRDIDDLASEPTEEAIRATLSDPNTSGAVIWITPDVDESHIIKNVEVPLAVARRRKGDEFWIEIVLAGGATYADVSAIFGEVLGGEDLSTWNLRRIHKSWARQSDVALVADAVLESRVKAVERDPLNVVVHARGTAEASAAAALSIDWNPYFARGAPTARGWAAMARAATSVSSAIKRLAAQVRVEYSGTPSLPAAMLLGSTYSTRDMRVPAWVQLQPDGVGLARWRTTDAKNSAEAIEAGWSPALRHINADASALAVVVDISDSTFEALGRSNSSTPAWRAILSVSSKSERNVRSSPLTPSEVASLVHLTIDAIRDARKETIGIDSVHFFIAGPAGFAFLLGTMLATLPVVTAYEFDTRTRRYVAGPSLLT